MAFATDTYVIRGMRQDDSDLLFNGNEESLSFAFENLNMRFTTDTETTNLVATQEKGNEICQINLVSSFFTDITDIPTIAWCKTTELPFRIIGHCVVDKYLVLFGKCLYTHTIGTGIPTIQFNSGEDVIIRLERINGIFYGWVLYKDILLGFDIEHPLETIGNVETNLIKKVYFVDGIHVPRAVNVVNQDAGLIANIDIGFHLQLNDEFTVNKTVANVSSNFPIGKVRFFYTYFNDNFSETNIVDWSPFFDCNLQNQGGAPGDQSLSPFAFRVTINNVDTQFKFVRIYFQHFTQNDSSTYLLKYIERPLSGNTFSTTVYFDGEDVQNATETYLDMKVTNYTFIPYTFAEKNNRLFYGNIKKHLPDISGISFANCVDVKFEHKEIGYEDLTTNLVYQYQSDNTTFHGSNFDYIGYRKYNWYRFGIIAQYKTGEWSNVMFLCDKRCTVSSKTEIEYEIDNQMIDPLNPSPNQPLDLNVVHGLSKRKRPIKSHYFVPNARLVTTDPTVFKQTLQQLLQLGYVRIKPVCVTPPPTLRSVITQGISCSTLYNGGNRRVLNNLSNGLFAIPSYFFRPLPLYPMKDDITQFTGYSVFKPHYPYTLRSVDDLKITKNITDNYGNWLLNPTFDNENYVHYNAPFREFRHGFSLPPKDRINAELQNSDLSIHDYFYKYHDYGNNPLFSPLLHDNYNNNANVESDGVNLFQFILDKNQQKSCFQPYYQTTVTCNSSTNPDWIYQLLDVYQTLPYHDIDTCGYDNLMFVDESICTLNSPEIDFCFDTDIKAFYKNQHIQTIGYAQITNSATAVDIPNATTQLDSSANSTHYSYNNTIDTAISGQCLFNVTNSLNEETSTYLNTFLNKSKIQNQPLLPTCGPWWLDSLFVNGFEWSGIDSTNTMRLFPLSPNMVTFNIHDNKTFDVRKNNLYGSSNDIDEGKTVKIFLRGLDKNPGIHNSHSSTWGFTDWYTFKWTSSFFGETNVYKNENNQSSTVVQPLVNAVYPYTANKNIALFIDFFPDEFAGFAEWNNHILLNISVNTLTKFTTHIFNWMSMGISYNVLQASENYADDAYWQNYQQNRTNLPVSHDIIPSGQVTLSRQYSPWYMPNVNNGTMYDDMIDSIYNEDYRTTMSYYFFPYYSTLYGSSFYKKPNPSILNGHESEYIKIHHPWILPYTNRHRWGNATELTNAFGTAGIATTIAGCETNTNIPYFEGSEYGCHYYAPFSTNFMSAYFDPYYAHIVYPFMDSDPHISFCTSYKQHFNNGNNNRPTYNSTHSHLYSNCTNYINSQLDAYTTYSAYYDNPNITQHYVSEPDLEMPFVPAASPRIYSYGYGSTNTSKRTLTLQDHTYTLTAAMKWYRGFKCLASSENDENLISNGCYLNKSSILGNLMFSGYLPQFFTHSGLLRSNAHDDYISGFFSNNTHFYENVNYIHVANSILQKDSVPGTYHLDNFVDGLNEFLKANQNRMIDVDFLSMPHVVYCNMDNDNTLNLLDKFYDNVQHLNVLLSSGVYNFQPQFYYKEFVSNPLNDDYNLTDINTYNQLMSDDNPYIAVYNTTRTIYPHTGHFESYSFQPLEKQTQPFWNTQNNISNYPQQITETQIPIDTSDINLINYDSSGFPRQEDNYWLLPISNMYNMDNVDNNPYTVNSVSCEQFDWKMCGDTYNIADVILTLPSQAVTQLVTTPLLFKEGDTYFQRYNCFKTISKDTMANLTDAAGNDVTETASVMIESYINLDGLYWNHADLTSIPTTSSPMLHPFYTLYNNINPVYNIKNDICDIFKQIDQNYYNAQLTHYPTEIIWSIKKQDGEVEDSWGIVPVTNKMLVSGEMGSINKLISYADNIYCLQDHGLSVLNYNPQVISPTSTDSTLSIYLSDATKLQDVTYISRNVGTLNKWSVTLGSSGIYWIDDTLKQFYHYGPVDGSNNLVNMSIKYGFNSWSNAVISSDNCVWDANVFSTGNNAFKANYDIKNNDIYWANGTYCICFNEKLDCFSSFYNYESIPYKFNYLDSCYSVADFYKNSNNVITNDCSTLWEDYKNYKHKLYYTPIDSYIELLVNPNGQYDKVFNFIEYYTEMYDIANPYDVAYPLLNPYNYIRVNNTYQIGSADFNNSNTQNRFKVWRTTIPREMGPRNSVTMNRIRSPWCKIKLQHKPELNTTDKQIQYRDKLHYINVNYTIPEQPLKTNIRR